MRRGASKVPIVRRAEYEGKVREALGGASAEVGDGARERAMSGRVGFSGAAMIE